MCAIQIDSPHIVGQVLIAGRDQECPLEQAPARVQLGMQCVGLRFPDGMKLVRQLERASGLEPVKFSLDAFDTGEVVEARNDVIEGVGLHRADRCADVVPQLEARDDPFHRGPPSRRGLLGQGIGHVEARAVELEKRLCQNVPRYPVVTLRAQGEQRLPKGDLVGRLVQAVQDQGLPVIGAGEFIVGGHHQWPGRDGKMISLHYFSTTIQSSGQTAPCYRCILLSSPDMMNEKNPAA